MTGNITPIREDIRPELDLERELLEWCQARIKQFTTESKIEPSRIAMVLIRPGDGEREMRTMCSTWDVEDKAARVETCALAALLLQERGMR